MGRGTLGLGVFLGAVVVLIWLQQALTWYYILQRPELAVVEKQRKKKWPLCGRVYNPTPKPMPKPQPKPKPKPRPLSLSLPSTLTLILTRCGRVYSTMNPRNPVNYFNLSLVLFEFLQFAAVLFHPLVPWVEEARDDHSPP